MMKKTDLIARALIVISFARHAQQAPVQDQLQRDDNNLSPFPCGSEENPWIQYNQLPPGTQGPQNGGPCDMSQLFKNLAYHGQPQGGFDAQGVFPFQQEPQSQNAFPPQRLFFPQQIQGEDIQQPGSWQLPEGGYWQPQKQLQQQQQQGIYDNQLQMQPEPYAWSENWERQPQQQQLQQQQQQQMFLQQQQQQQMFFQQQQQLEREQELLYQQQQQLIEQERQEILLLQREQELLLAHEQQQQWENQQQWGDHLQQQQLFQPDWNQYFPPPSSECCWPDPQPDPCLYPPPLDCSPPLGPQPPPGWPCQNWPCEPPVQTGPPAPPPVTPGTPDFLCPGNVPGWVHFRGREFYLGSPQGLTWLEADAKATDAATTTIPTGHSPESNVSHLLQIETLEERELVHDLIARCYPSSTSFWLGGNDLAHKDHWVWSSDGSPVPFPGSNSGGYENWAPGVQLPLAEWDERRCMELGAMGNGELEWRPADCSDERRERAYIAEKGTGGQDPGPTTIATTAQPTTARPTAGGPSSAAPTTAKPTARPTLNPGGPSSAAPTTAKPTARPTLNPGGPSSAAPTTVKPTLGPGPSSTTAGSGWPSTPRPTYKPGPGSSSTTGYPSAASTTTTQGRPTPPQTTPPFGTFPPPS